MIKLMQHYAAKLKERYNKDVTWSFSVAENAFHFFIDETNKIDTVPLKHLHYSSLACFIKR